MSRTRLSKISMTPQGTWDSATEYKRLDVVSNAGASWLAKRDNVGVTPVEGEDWMNLVDPDNGGYHSIETITISDNETVEIVRTQEPDGTAYNFKAIWIFLFGKQNFRTMYVNLNETTDSYIGLLTPSQEYNYYTNCKYKICGRLIEGGYSGAGYLGDNWKVRNSIPGIPEFASGKNTITKIRLTTSDAATLTSGTKIYIYAVRA